MSGYRKFSETSALVLQKRLYAVRRHDAGFWGNLGKELHDSVLGKMDYGIWTQKLRGKLAELDVALNEFDPHAIVDWYESGYSLDEAVQAALSEGAY